MYDLNKILSEFDGTDFGFSAVSEEEYNAALNEKDDTVEQYKHKLEQVEKLVLPFLAKLIQTSDKPYIYWPNRKEVIEKNLQKILELTRG